MDFSKLRNFMDALCNWRIPGNACIVYYKRRPVFQYASGFSNIETGQKMQGSELLYMYSATKPVTCAAALTLWEQGKFILTDPVKKYLPEWADVQVRYTASDGTEHLRAPARDVTVQDLFTMQSGLDYNYNAPALAAAREKYAPECPTREMARAIAAEPLLFDPGTRWCYGFSHDILAALVEVIAGEPFSAYVKRTIFDVIGMNETTFGADEERQRQIAVLYNFSDEKNAIQRDPTQRNGFIFGSQYDSGGAGLVSTVSDMAKFTDVMCGRGLVRDGVRILAPRTVDLMRRNHLQTIPASLSGFAGNALMGYGYGLGVRTLVDPAVAGSPSPIGEFGWTGAAGAYMLMDPENELAMFYAHHMTNNQEDFTAPRLRNVLYSCLA